MSDERNGNFTSSSMEKIAAKGKAVDSIGAPFFTYVKEKRREIRADRSMNKEAKAASLQWGNCCEQIAHDKLGDINYRMTSKKRFKHPTLPWSGMPDELYGREMVSDIKCPYTLNSYYDTLEIIEECQKTGNHELFKKKCAGYFWQNVSNGILAFLNGELDKGFECESIIFMPRREDLAAIKFRSEYLSVYGDADGDKGYYFHKKEDYELPWLGAESKDPSLLRFKYKPTEEEKDFLTSRIEFATKERNK